MGTRLKAVAPLVVSIGVLAFLATELALNFTFHWVTVQDTVFGKFGVPQDVHIVLPAIFVAWGLFFLLGATNAALGKTIIAAASGSIFAGIGMVLGPVLADAPDFWGLARGHRTDGHGPGGALDHGGRRPLRARPGVRLLRVGVLLVDRHRPRQLRAGRQGPAHRRGRPRGDHQQAAGRRHRRIRRPDLDVVGLGHDQHLLLARRRRPVRAGLGQARRRARRARRSAGPRPTSRRSPSAPSHRHCAGGGLQLVVRQRAGVEQQPAVLDAADQRRVAGAQRGGERVGRVGQGDDRPGQLEQRERAAADAARRTRRSPRPRSAPARRSARAAAPRRRRSIASTGISSRRVAMQPQRRLQRGQRELVDPQRPGQRVARAPPRPRRRGRRAARPAGRRAACRRRSRPAPRPPRPSGRTAGSSTASSSAPEPTSSITGTPSSHSASIATSSTNPSWRKFDGCTRRIAPVSARRSRARSRRAGCGSSCRPRPAARPPGRSRPARGTRRRSPRAARARRSTSRPGPASAAAASSAAPAPLLTASAASAPVSSRSSSSTCACRDPRAPVPRSSSRFE